MIPNYPYFGFPNYNRYFSFGHGSNYTPKKSNVSELQNKKDFSSPNYNNLNKNVASSNTQFDCSFSKSDKKNDDFINIFGISLHVDDILILCLLFFLFSEKTDDYVLIFVLVLLLLT